MSREHSDPTACAKAMEEPVLPTPEDQVAIIDLLARYCLTLDMDDVDGWVGLYLPDGLSDRPDR